MLSHFPPGNHGYSGLQADRPSRLRALAAALAGFLLVGILGLILTLLPLVYFAARLGEDSA